MKKLLQITTYSLFMALSCAAYAENDELALVNRDAVGLREDVVFTLLRKTKAAEFLSLLAKKPVKTWSGSKYKYTLPFGDLADKLVQKGEQLAKPQSTPSLDKEKQKVLEDLVKEREASGASQTQILFELLRDNEIVKDVLKSSPGLTDQIELMFAYLHDTKEIFEGLSGMQFNIDQIEKLNTKDLIKSVTVDLNLSPSEFEELLDAVYNDEIEQYNKFVEENKAILEKIAALADNGFKVKTMVKKCRTIRNKEFCTSGNEEREIKALSEIMPYITHLQENPAIDAPRDDL